MGVIAMPQSSARIVGPLLLYMCLVACSEPEPPPADQGTSPPPTSDPPAAAAEIMDQATPEPSWETPRLRAAIREARNAHRERAYNYHSTVLAASDAYVEDKEGRNDAYETSLVAYEASKAAYDAEDATEPAKEELATIHQKIEDAGMRFIRHERDWEQKEKELAALGQRQEELENQIASSVSEAVNARSAAYRAAAEAWTALLPTATHEHAAVAAEKAAGMNPGAFGRIGEVHAYFMRCTSRINPLTGVGEQKRCYDYGVAMLTYFALNPISDIEDKYENMNRSVVNRMGAIGWKTGDRLQFQAVR